LQIVCLHLANFCLLLSEVGTRQLDPISEGVNFEDFGSD
jgi:hypothetical protein